MSARCAGRPDREFPLLAELLRFFDHYLLGLDTGLEREDARALLHDGRGAMARAAAMAAASTQTTTLFLADDGRLAAEAGSAGEDRYSVDFALATGDQTRYGRLAAFDVRDYYTDWHGRDARMLCYTGEPLAADHELSGHPCVTLHLSASEADAGAPRLSRGRGAGRNLPLCDRGHVAGAASQGSARRRDHHQVVGPYHSFARADAAPLVPGEVATLRFSLLPTSWRVAAGHRLRLAIAGADADNFGQVPHGRPPMLAIHRGGVHASSIDLPLQPESLQPLCFQAPTNPPRWSDG